MRGETGSKSVSDASVSKFYAVKCGKVPGIYTDWPSAQEQIIGWTKPKHKCFSTRAEAQRFVDGEMDLEPPLQRFKEVNGAAKPAKPTPAPEPYDPSSYEPGTGALPPGAVDGFDPNIILDRKTNTLVYKTPAQMKATKMQTMGPLPDTMLRIYTDGAASKNGQLGALAGVGVYFGPGDER
jgi:ribonuclease HI